MSKTNQLQLLIVIRTIGTVLALSFVGVLRAEPAAPTVSAASLNDAVPVGARVRISHSQRGHTNGTLVRLDSNDIVIRQTGKKSDTTFARSEVSKLEKSEGKTKNRAAGLVIGLVSGVTLGVVSGYATGDSTSCGYVGCYELSEKENIVGGAIFGGLALGALGYYLGVPGEKWIEIGQPTTRIELGTTPRGDAALMLHRRF